MTTFYGDTETFCETPLEHGLHRYAEKVEITVLAWAIDEGPVEVIDCTRPGWEDKVKVALAAADAADEQVWQNSAFDRTVMRHAWGYEMPVERVVDTMVQALAHGLPGSLDKLCSVLGVPTDLAKHKEGKQLVQLFCKPRPKTSKVRRATRETHPIEWQRFLDYAGSDILSMREVRKRLPKWNYPGNQRERDLWVLDQKINDRGVAVDLALAEAAVRATDLAKKGLKAKTQELTGFDPETGQGLESTTQRDAFLKYLLGEFGVDLPDMQKGTLERRLADENLPEPVKDLLRIRLMATVSSTAKYKTLLRGTSGDGRLRGTLQFCGAARTGRWAGRLFQPQNLMRPTLKQQAILDAIEAFLADCADLVYDNVMNTAANCTRGALTVGPGKKMVSSDLANIEGRFLAWLAGEEWKLQAFRAFDAGTGPDLYYVGASEVLNIPIDQVTADQRQAQGKVPELACLLEGTLVLTARGEVPIETVLPGDFVWDGMAWVQTDGPVFKGEKRVIAYDGISATPDHLVWVEGQTNPVELGRAAVDGLRLVRAGPRDQARASALGPQADSRQATLHEPQGQGVQKLRGPGREVRLPDGGARLRLGVGELGTAAREARSGSGGQRRELRGREPALVNTQDQQVAHAAQQEVDGVASVPANTPGGPVRGHHAAKPVGGGSDLRPDSREVDAAELQTQGRVWDLLNCGPLHRFTAAGRLVHNCGYQGAVGAFQAMARIYGLEMSDARALEIVKAWRKKNKHIVELWYETERAAIRAAEQPGLRVEAAGGKLVFQRDGSWLRMRLPSGRCLCYPGVAVEEGKLSYMGVNQYTRKWERLFTYGGKLIENATQGGARDVLAHNMAEAEAAGYEIVLTCHDELVTETLESGQFTAERLSAIMSTVPPWATGLPLAASGWEGPRYRK